MPRTNKLIARIASIHSTRPRAINILGVSAAAGATVIATGVVMRVQLVRALRKAGAASAAAARSLGTATEIDRFLAGAGLHKRKPVYLRGLPVIAILGGVLAAGAAALLLAPRWRAASVAAAQPAESDESSSAGKSVLPGSSKHTGKAAAHNHGIG
jgi:hypothetical protein